MSKAEFQCKGCGTCCRWEGHVLLTSEDIRNLAEVLGLTEEDFIEQYTELATNRKALTLKDRPDGACILLEGSRHCRVYEHRPAQCRDYPHQWNTKQPCPNYTSL